MSNPKYSLSIALQGLTDVARIVESEDYDPENIVIQRVINQMLIDINLPSTVDNCFEFDAWLDKAQEKCQEWIKKFQTQKKRFKETKENFRRAGSMQLKPGEKVTGTLGSIGVQRRKRYDLTCTDRPKNEIGPAEIKEHEIPDKYIISETKYYVDKKKAEEDFKLGLPVPFLKESENTFMVLRANPAAKLEK